MSALPPKADITEHRGHVRFVQADSCTAAKSASLNNFAGSYELGALSIRNRAARSNRSRPFLQLAGNEARQIFGAAPFWRGHSHPDAGEAFTHQRRFHYLARRPRKPAHDTFGRSFRKREGAPGTTVEIREALLLRGRQFGQYRRPCGAKRYDSLHSARLNLRESRGNLLTHEVDAPKAAFRNPITGIGCCARALSGHAAAPPSPAMNLLIRSPRRRGREAWGES